MKKIQQRIIMAILAISCINAGVMAETVKFTPLNFSDTNTVNIATTTTTTKPVVVNEGKGTDLLDPSQVTGGSKMQNAILQIDNAEVEVRNKLLNYKNSYAEIDARYNNVKTERKAMKKQIQQAEKKIKNLDKAKTKIRKNFERKANV